MRETVIRPDALLIRLVRAELRHVLRISKVRPAHFEGSWRFRAFLVAQRSGICGGMTINGDAPFFFEAEEVSGVSLQDATTEVLILNSTMRLTSSVSFQDATAEMLIFVFNRSANTDIFSKKRLTLTQRERLCCRQRLERRAEIPGSAPRDRSLKKGDMR